MNYEKYLSYLDQEDLSKISSRFKKHKYLNPTELFYEGHTPNLTYILVDGTIEIIKKKKLIKEVHQQGLLIGLSELVKNASAKFDAKIAANSEVLAIERSEIIDILDDREDPLNRVLNNVLH